ncbi:hypothetical protein [Psychrobacter sp. BF1]|uniref:hypothetical protein n=1 Tax=Psychrobacter sp. BF1 TaxID=2821147 RepID=UPI001C4DF87E|nr:hypothetical protein [Psychrobacter sp. BF1]
MINIENLTINISTKSSVSADSLDTQDSLIVRDELVSMLRIISKDEIFSKQTVVIPDDCEQYGFAEGEFKLPELLYFLADMLE